MAEQHPADHGRFKIDVNAGARVVEVRGGNSLLMALRDSGVFIPSACGGRGICAYCKVKILEGGGPVGPTELPLLTQAEAADNVRISCQCKVRNDLRIEVPDALLRGREFKGHVERIRDLTYDIKELRIKLVQPRTIDFVPGQYIQLDAPPRGDGSQPASRAYSMSGLPSDRRYVELMVRLAPGGICTTWIFQHLREGDEVTFTGPFGDLRLTDTDKEMVWIAGGSGMAPFWSMVRHLKERNSTRKCTYFFGAVGDRDLFLVDELRKLEAELAWFTFVPALSGAGQDSKCPGQRGLITEVVARQVADGRDKEAYLCGSPEMIDAAIRVLREKGFTDDRIFFDKFA